MNRRRPIAPVTASPHLRRSAFTLVEMLVAFAVLALLMVMINALFTSTIAVTGMRNKQMDNDAQARAVFDRMAIDFSQMVKRTDVDYFLKSATADQYGNMALQPGNDQLAFYSQVPGYYPSTNGTFQSPLSLVAYRINADSNSPYFNQLQRYGLGLLWNGVATSGSQIVFSSGPSGATSAPGTNDAISNNWPVATNMSPASGYEDPNFELAGPQVFRMEYYYVLKGQTVAGVSYPSILTDTPWDTRIPNHISVNGLQDVAAIAVVIAVVDPKSRILANLTTTQLTTLANSMEDFSIASTPNPGNLESQWQAAINSDTGIPRAAAEAIRVYGRTFYLPPN